MKSIVLKKAKTHNLKSIDFEAEPGQMIVLVGPSGAGKSSLAFSTLYAEGQRRYVESFSAYARQFLERLARPPVEKLEPVPVGIAVDRKAPVKTSRSTVGTMTELTDFAKVLWAKNAELICPSCSETVRPDHPQQAAQKVLEKFADEKILVTYPQKIYGPEGFIGVRESLLEDGYRRVQIDGQTKNLEEVRPSEIFKDLDGSQATTQTAQSKVAKKKTAKKKASKKRGWEKTNVEVNKTVTPNTNHARVLHVVADRLVAREKDRSRLVEALEVSFQKGSGKASVQTADGKVFHFSSSLHCAKCDLDFREPSPGLFSFNNPIGACESCRGFGRVITMDLDRVIPDKSLTLNEDAVKAWAGKAAAWERKQLRKHAPLAGIPMDVPLSNFTEAQWDWLIQGDDTGWPKGWFGIESWFKWLESRAYKMHVRVFLSRFRKYTTCPTCDGSRLKKEALNWKIQGKSIAEFYSLPITSAQSFMEEEIPKYPDDPALSLLLEECQRRLSALSNVGLGYLSLNRQSRTLSGGEAQRVSLTSALGAAFTGTMFVLDEPTVGLHPKDVETLAASVKNLSKDGNTVIVVEHDAHMIRTADRVVELGPGAGEYGGSIVFDGTPEELSKAKTKTASVVSRKIQRANVKAPTRRKAWGWIKLTGASGNNLKNANLQIPLNALTCITGVSGSGKSSLIQETLRPALEQHLSMATSSAPLSFDTLEGFEKIYSLVQVDQSPLGRTSRGNPATYLKVWDLIRKRFTNEKLSKERGYLPGFFSFNVPGGRCESCKGEGFETVEMQFLADVTFSCADCGGKRFLGPVLEVKHCGLNISEVLQLTATEALTHFTKNDSSKQAQALRAKLKPLVDVGLGYIRLGQPLNTLSGGEAQRLKLAHALSNVQGGTMVILDEPTAGLHAEDVKPLLKALHQLVDAGNTVVVIEHDMEVAASADYVVDLGPGPGKEGGHIVAKGTPEEVAMDAKSVTAVYLAEALGLKTPDSTNKTKANKKKTTALKNKSARRQSTAEESTSTPGIVIRGAKEHNLKDVNVVIPRNQLVVVTGPSGSGKSTLAFDVVYAEGQRRYLETLSPYARQYMPQLSRPHVDQVIGVPPCVSLEQRIRRGGANSTVATLTEVAHYLRLLWAKAGTPHCPDHPDMPIAARSPKEIAKDLKRLVKKSDSASGKLTLLTPVVRSKKGLHKALLAQALKKGFTEARIDGKYVALKPGLSLDRYKEHDVELVTANVTVQDTKLESSIAHALTQGKGALIVHAHGKNDGEDFAFSSTRACPACGKGFGDLDPRFFSFNTKQGACEKCEGKGFIVKKNRRGRAKEEVHTHCESCDGTRLSSLARSVTLNDHRIHTLMAKSVSEAKEELAQIQLEGRQKKIGKTPLSEAERRLDFLNKVGLGYLQLDRAADTLSGGEMQRVRLAAQLGSGLTGVLYVLDEPTIGLHPRDNRKLLDALHQLVENGNSVIVVEHDAETILSADHMIDVGPAGGRHGGHVVAQGTPQKLLTDSNSVTGPSLSKAAPIPEKRREVKSKHPHVEVFGAREHNLQSVHAQFPCERFVTVTGISGSGKSTLVREVTLRALREKLDLVTKTPGAHKSIKGTQHFTRAIEIDQSPIGRTPRSVPATYINIWDQIRALLAATPEARSRGYKSSRFSFNTKEGRCPVCEGQGARQVEMAFLPDVHVECEGCKGARFDDETLQIQWKGMHAGQLLDLEVEQAVEVFKDVTKVERPLQLLLELGLGYLKLGQPSNTLSGGEAQRLKLVSELTSAQSGTTFYVMDEPTTGLHREDVLRLLSVIQKFVDRGDTVVVIEHNTDVMLASDWIIDLGPEGGKDGGMIVAVGTPEDIAKNKHSQTAKFLKQELKNSRKQKKSVSEKKQKAAKTIA